MKSLKYVCRQKIEDTFNIKYDYFVPNQLKDDISVFQQIGPSLSRQTFSKYFGNDKVEFHKFLCFLHRFVWNLKYIRKSDWKVYIKFDHNESILANWINKWYYQLSEISFVGFKYLGGQMCILIMYYCEYKIVKLDHQKFDYNPMMLKENGENCNKLLKLTVMSCDLLDCCQS